MTGIRVLFLGGTGVISSACARAAVGAGIELSVLNRGQTRHRPLPAGVTVLHGDAHDPARVRDVLAGRTFDAVVNWVAFTPEQVQADVEVLRGRTGQYVFISSASAYQTAAGPAPGHRVDAAARTRTGEYSRNKIACEERLMRGLPRERLPDHDRPAVAHLRQTIVPFDGGWTRRSTASAAASRSSCTAMARRCGR